MKPHKHAELIKAWADGAKIQKRGLIGSHVHVPQWEDEDNPRWLVDYWEYRIKPEQKPDIVEYLSLFVRENPAFHTGWQVLGDSESDSNLKLTFDAKTLKLKSAEVLK